jgi:hypothetical protein
MKSQRLCLLLVLSAFTLLLAAGFAAKDGALAPATPAEFVKTYESLADAILAVKKTETNLVLSILATTYGHAQAQLERARQALKAGDDKSARSAVEDLATLVAHLGTEGDNSVARVRKRLLEGGHHHNAEGEAKGIFDEGYVVVTKAAKKRFLDASRAIGLLQSSPAAEALEREWKSVQSAWTDLMKETK